MAGRPLRSGKTRRSRSGIQLTNKALRGTEIEGQLLHAWGSKRRVVRADNVVVADNAGLHAQAMRVPVGHGAHLAVVGLRRSDVRGRRRRRRGSGPAGRRHSHVRLVVHAGRGAAVEHVVARRGLGVESGLEAHRAGKHIRTVELLVVLLVVEVAVGVGGDAHVHRARGVNGVVGKLVGRVAVMMCREHGVGLLCQGCHGVVGGEAGRMREGEVRPEAVLVRAIATASLKQLELGLEGMRSPLSERAKNHKGQVSGFVPDADAHRRQWGGRGSSPAPVRIPSERGDVVVAGVIRQVYESRQVVQVGVSPRGKICR